MSPINQSKPIAGLSAPTDATFGAKNGKAAYATCGFLGGQSVNHAFRNATITKHDRPVARLVPADRPSREHVAAIFRQMDALRQSLPPAKDQDFLKDLINQGRRF